MVATNAELLGETLVDIADAIREKRGTFGDIDFLDMADEIRQIASEDQVYLIHVVPPDLAQTGQVEQQPIPSNSIDVNNVSIDLPTIEVNLEE